MKLTVSSAEILNTGHILRHDAAFPHETTDVHVLMDMGIQTPKRKMDGKMVSLRFVFSRVLPSASVRDCMRSVLQFLCRTWSATFTLRTEFCTCFPFTRAVPNWCNCLLCFILTILPSGSSAHLPCSVGPLSGAKVGAKDILCTSWPRFSDVKYRRHQAQVLDHS